MLRRTISLLSIVSLVACGSDNKKKAPDAPIIDDAPPDTAPACGASITPPAPQYLSKDLTTPDILWYSVIPNGLDGNDLYVTYEFYGGVEPNLMGTFDLAMGNQTNYKTCAICVRATELDSQGNSVKEFFQSGGSIMLTEDPFTNQHMLGSISNVTLQEVTIASDYTSTPVAGGACHGVSNMALDKIAAAEGWTCTGPQYEDGTTCNCMCGVQDTDCDTDANTVMGCTTGPHSCFAGNCVTPPVNDTCQLATPIVVNAATATTGTTIGASHSYENGLSDAACTGFGQPGPDVAYTVAMTAATQYTITLSGLDAMYDGSVYLLGPSGASPAICDADPIITCVKGSDAGLDGITETFTYTAGATDTYYLVVDSGYPSGPHSAGNFTLAVTSP
jgi:hypothetical protein